MKAEAGGGKGAAWSGRRASGDVHAPAACGCCGWREKRSSAIDTGTKVKRKMKKEKRRGRRNGNTERSWREKQREKREREREKSGV